MIVNLQNFHSIDVAGMSFLLSQRVQESCFMLHPFEDLTITDASQMMDSPPLEQALDSGTSLLGSTHKDAEHYHTASAQVSELVDISRMAVMAINHDSGVLLWTVLWRWMLFLLMEATFMRLRPNTRISSMPCEELQTVLALLHISICGRTPLPSRSLPFLPIFQQLLKIRSCSQCVSLRFIADIGTLTDASNSFPTSTPPYLC